MTVDITADKAPDRTLDKTPDFSFYINRRTHWTSFLINGVAIAYVVLGYGFALFCLTQPVGWINLAGVVLLIHTLVWAAYFVHEFVHGTIFRQPRWNAAFGRLMLFITGSCYSAYRDIASNHLAHHKNRADFSVFSIPNFLRSLPKPLLQIIVALEWLYFPVINFMFRWLNTLSPFLGQSRRDERLRNAALLLLRGSLFTALALYDFKAVLLYFFAYICFINILRFIDCFQHTYTVFQLGQPLPHYSLEHEETNTFSNLVSRRWSWLNLLLLNFSYHNAHHRVIRCPWYLLPQLDAELYPRNYRQYVTLGRLVRNYHCFRIHRLFNDQGVVIETENGLDLDRFVGAVGVSFLFSREPLDWLKLPEDNGATSPLA
ncbi:MAG: fatty acid desaturase [Oscillatoriophycideae cyanobacterium NC_groundwater_1537_Pr4_S-0.65um_50_18]|nr:fatty acid desaturase [Oscillatoriophycideae cyanobacterium NC_groundwater_1537_Pr4_S-0.65um_50_18]